MLAYVFWHRPAGDVERDDYEARLRAFHATLGVPSACFRLRLLPWRHADGYEDWYVVEDWAALGELNAAAVAPPRRAEHDAAAARTAEGWGGVYALVHGEPVPPAAARWARAPEDGAEAVWRRQLVLGPAPEYCLGGGEAHGRVRVV